MSLSFGLDNRDNFFLLGKYKQMESLRFFNLLVLMINEIENNLAFSYRGKSKIKYEDYNQNSQKAQWIGKCSFYFFK